LIQQSNIIVLHGLFSEAEWHMIIGGAGSPNTVELYNWHTNQQCQLPNLPVGVFGHVAALFKMKYD